MTRNSLNFLLLFCVFSFAEDIWDFSAKIGINLGGTMPRPMPNNISKVESYSPNLAPTIEAEALRWISKKIGISAGTRLENKGMKSTASVKEYSIKLKNSDDNATFNGMVDTEMSFNYLGLPILAHYAFSKNFSVYAGAYYAYLLSGEFKVTARDGLYNDGKDTPITFNHEGEKTPFSEYLRNYDTGLSIGLNFMPYNEHILVSFGFNYGLVSVFPDDFTDISDDMQNVYGKLSVGYLF